MTLLFGEQGCRGQGGGARVRGSPRMGGAPAACPGCPCPYCTEQRVLTGLVLPSGLVWLRLQDLIMDGGRLGGGRLRCWYRGCAPAPTPRCRGTPGWFCQVPFSKTVPRGAEEGAQGCPV